MKGEIRIFLLTIVMLAVLLRPVLVKADDVGGILEAALTAKALSIVIPLEVTFLLAIPTLGLVITDKDSEHRWFWDGYGILGGIISGTIAVMATPKVIRLAGPRWGITGMSLHLLWSGLTAYSIYDLATRDKKSKSAQRNFFSLKNILISFGSKEGFISYQIVL
jgi:hypothetical protein